MCCFINGCDKMELNGWWCTRFAWTWSHVNNYSKLISHLTVNVSFFATYWRYYILYFACPIYSINKCEFPISLFSLIIHLNRVDWIQSVYVCMYIYNISMFFWCRISCEGVHIFNGSNILFIIIIVFFHHLKVSLYTNLVCTHT